MELSAMDRMIIPGLFTSQEKQSMYQVMCALRHIGNHHMAEKQNHIYEVMALIGMTTNDQVQSRTLSQAHMTSVLKQMNQPQKLYFAKFVSITGLIGGVSEKESLFINWIFSEVNVPTDY